MAINAINTKALLANYIKTMLGEPVITVEITPEQLDHIIDTTVQKFADFSMGGDTPKTFLLDLVPGVNSYMLDDRIQAVTKVRSKSNSFNFQMPGTMITPSEICASSMNLMGGMDLTNMAAVLGKISTLEHMFDVEPNWNYNSNSKMLDFLDNTSSLGANKVLLETYMSYSPRDYDMIYNHQWIKEYSLALTKRHWGSNIGKYNATLINGATLNYDRILQEADRDIEKLDQELLTRWSAPLGIYRA